MAKAPKPDDALHAQLSLYEKVVSSLPNVERKGASIPYTSLNGHMFSYLTKTGQVALRLPEAARTAFLEKYETTLCVAHGIVQKEYVIVPAALLKKTAELKKHFAASYAYVGSLKPKPTTRKKPAKKAAKKPAR